MIKSIRSMNETMYDSTAPNFNFNRIKVGDKIIWNIEGVGRLPKVGDQFRVGPFVGTCTKSASNQVVMQVEGDSRSDNLDEALDFFKNPESMLGSSGLEVTDPSGGVFYTKADRLVSDLKKQKLISSPDDAKAIYAAKEKGSFIMDLKDGSRLRIKRMGK